MLGKDPWNPVSLWTPLGWINQVRRKSACSSARVRKSLQVLDGMVCGIYLLNSTFWLCPDKFVGLSWP